MRYWVPAFVAVFAFTACKKESAPIAEQQQQQASDQSGSSDEQVAEAPVAEAAAEAEKEPEVEVTPELVAKYVAYQKAAVAAYQEEVKKFTETAKKADGNSMSGAMSVVSASAQMAEAVGKREEAARKAAGLSEAELSKVKDVVGDTVFVHKLALKNQAELEKSFADTRRRLEDEKNTPPEQREAALKFIETTEQAMKAQLELRDARATHGDKAVDAVLAHEDAIYDLQQQAANAMKM